MPEGDIVVNPQTGERRVLRGGQWVPEGQASSAPAPAPQPQAAPQGAWSITPMESPAQQRQAQQDAYQRERNAASDAREEERLRMARAAEARAQAAADPNGIKPAGADARTRLTLGLGPLVEAQRTMARMEGTGYSFNQDPLARALEAVPLDGGAAARLAGGEDYQQYDQAARTFEASVMPIMSGAAVTPSEAQRQIRANLPQYGDTPQILATKARNRAMMINAAAALVGQEQPFPEIGVWGADAQGGDQPASAPSDMPGAALATGGLASADPAAPAPPQSPSPSAPSPQGPPNLDALSRDEIVALNLQPGDEVMIGGEVRIIQSPPSDGPARDRINADERGVIYRTLDPQALQDARDRAAQTPGQLRSFNQGATFNMGDELVGAASGLETRALNLGRSITGQDIPYTAQDAENAVRFAERERDQQFARERPVQDFAFNVAGGLVAPGSRSAGRFVMGDANASARGGNAAARLMTSPKLVPQATRGAMTGGAAGAAYGYGDATGTPTERLPGAAEGARVGAMTGGAAPTVGRAVGGVVNRIVAPPVRGAVRALNRATGGNILNPQSTARDRLIETMKADKIDPATIQRALADWDSAGGPSATFLDIISANGGGQQTRALIRGAAMSGPARNEAAQYANRVEADIQGNAINRTRELTPETRPVQAVAEDLTARRQAQAETDYRGPYQTSVNISPELRSALGDAPGRQALLRARAAAVARRNEEQVMEIDDLLANEANSVSAGVLDRTRIAMSERGQVAGQRGARDQAGGLRDRANDINTALEAVPEIAPARANYRDASQQIEGLGIGQGIRNASPDQLAADLAARPGARQTAPIGAARKLEEDIGRPAEGSTGALNTIASSTNMRRNLATVFGEQDAARYQQAIGQIVEQVRNGRFINPNTGSQTAGRAVDEALVAGAPNSPGFWLNLWQKLSSGQTTLTDKERQAIVQIATSEASNAPVPRIQGQPVTPRMVAPVSGYEARNRRDQPTIRMTR